MSDQSSDCNQYLDKKLSMRMKIYFVLSIVIFAVSVYEVIVTGYSPLFAFGLQILGIIVGFIISRMFHLSRDDEAQVVTSRIDLLGGIILVCYIAFSIARHYFLGQFIDSSLVIVVTFAIISGTMIGRFLAMRRSIGKIIADQQSK